MKSKDVIKNLNDLSINELQKTLQEKSYSLIKNKMEFNFGKNKVHSNINKTKKEIARISTVLNEKLTSVINKAKEQNEK